MSHINICYTYQKSLYKKREEQIVQVSFVTVLVLTGSHLFLVEVSQNI